MHKSVHGIIAIMLVLAAVMAAVAILSEHGGQRMVSNDQEAPAGSSGIARPHPPLDRAPGEPLKTPL